MLNFIIAHSEDVLAAYGFIVGLCSVVVKWTPTPKDDAIWEKVLKVLDFFSTTFLKSDALKIAKGEEKLAEEAKEKK